MTDKTLPCPWLGYGIAKGVTDPVKNISVLGLPTKGGVAHGLHRELLEGFPGIDPYPLCYENVDHENGFGGFIRWVYFTDPKGKHDVLGIDYSVIMRPTSGVANSMLVVREVVGSLIDHGISPSVEVALLDTTMTEFAGVTAIRRNAGLNRAVDWVILCDRLFGEEGTCCPRCGQALKSKEDAFCIHCGCKPALVRGA